MAEHLKKEDFFTTDQAGEETQVNRLNQKFEVGDPVINIIAFKNDWPNCKGEVIEVNGSDINVRYESGVEKWELSIDFKKVKIF
jgi:hypothetical protein